MRNGRGPNRDHDQKSVELKHRTKMSRPTLQTHAAKLCAECNCLIACYDRREHGDLDRRGVLALNREDLLGFDHDKTSSITGFQSWCKECKDRWEHRPAAIFSRTRSFLIREEPETWAEWESCSGGAFAEFQRKWEHVDGVCHYCEAGLRQWQVSGHVLDRIDNKIRRHTPGNTTLCCWPCNHSKGERSPFAWEMELKPYLDRFGPGNVPHGARSDRYKQVEIRSTRHWVIVDGTSEPEPDRQMGLAL